MTTKTTTNIRKTFLDFFNKNDHTIVESHSLVPRNDPTLMFTNAGMVQFKDIFTGRQKSPYNRATSVQKCLRAGGKHNDLENVGYTARHHTFFEMLGNFSFGDYFKEQAIVYAFDLITKEFCIPKDKLLVTVYHEDEESFNLWRKIAGFADDRIIKIATNDNFWSMGDTGPCGPCTEIFYDHGETVAGGPPGSINEDGDRFVEIWNLVFMQYEQHANGTRTSLPQPCVDTGMGLERIAAVIQGVHNNYDTDLFKNLIEKSQELCSATPAQQHHLQSNHLQSHRVIADHLRACAFMLADGILPSNEGRGYVLRRIMRRGLRHAHLLSPNKPIMSSMAGTIVGLMSDAYPELSTAHVLIQQTIEQEEKRFDSLLERGLKLLDEAKNDVGDDKVLDGSVAFKLYDTYGFPLDLTQDILKQDNISVDEGGFSRAMDQQKKQARAAWVGSGDKTPDRVWFDLFESFGATQFVGYKMSEVMSKGVVQAILTLDGQHLDDPQPGQECLLITNQTPFYAESGGQVGDSGWILNEIDPPAQRQMAKVLDTQKKLGGLYVHHLLLDCDPKNLLNFNIGRPVTLLIDGLRRQRITANHSATHLLHASLRKILGDHVVQKGSVVDSERLRFDFSHPTPLTDEELQAVEYLVNVIIFQNLPSQIEILSLEEAKSRGAVALFGEKYTQDVRVVTFGCGKPNHHDHSFSMELCGGTHVHSTGMIGLVKITQQSSCGAGIRRIEAVSCFGVLDYIRRTQNDSAEQIDTLKKQIKELGKTINNLNNKEDFNYFNDINKTQVKEYVLWDLATKDLKPKDLKGIADQLKKKMTQGVLVITNTNEDKITLIIAVTNDLSDRLSALDMARKCARFVGAKEAGGHQTLAQTGGTQTGGSDDTPIQSILITIREALNE